MSNTPPSSDPLLPIDLIYHALEDERYWKDFLDFVVKRLNLAFAAFGLVYPRRQSQSLSYYVGLPEEVLKQYLTHWVHEDPWVKTDRAWGLPVGQIIRSEHVIPDEELCRTAAFREWMQPIGYHYGAGMVLARSDYQFAYLSVYRGTSLGPLSELEFG